MKRRTISRVFRFAMLGALALGVNLSGTYLLHEGAGWPEEASFGVMLLVIMGMNFLLCRYVVFPGSQMVWWRQLGQFVASSFLFRMGEWLAFALLLEWLGAHYLITVALVLGTSFAAKFLFYSRGLFQARVEVPGG